MDYLSKLELTQDNIEFLTKSLEKGILDKLELFPHIVEANYNILKDVGINNYKEIFLSHTHMFLMNPNRFKAIFDKYDHDDLIRCLEKNGDIIEKL